ncbi:TetR/AcrR family transcriptional regulator [Staphylococcus gallinarum]|uniref:TetR/AcrR family transcriptional regulator n=1 Tax=Staphylococcus gallinarum TaxID=1293 RepID=UPI002440F996|nr:TetR/AcrR family transcriptional regulator [Staphylococcus gallinarum]
MHKSDDLRVVKTKKALKTGLFNLLQKKEFKKLSIHDICDESIVHRTTFYRHYNDKYDLLFDLIDELTQDYVFKDIKNLIYSPFQSVYESFEENRKNIEKIGKKQRHDSAFDKLILQFVINKLTENFNANIENIEMISSVPKGAYIHIYVSVIDGLSKWAETIDREVPIEELDNIYNDIIKIEYKE